MDIKLINAEVKDWEKILQLEKSCNSRLFAAFETESEIKDLFKSSEVYWIKVGGEIVGEVSVEKKDKSNYLSGMAIFPKFQGKGYGKKVLAELIQKYAGKFTLTVHPENTPAIIIYLKAGFKIVGWEDNPFGDGEPRLLMEKD